jgi:hypothetical protein
VLGSNDTWLQKFQHARTLAAIANNGVRQHYAKFEKVRWHVTFRRVTYRKSVAERSARLQRQHLLLAQHHLHEQGINKQWCSKYIHISCSVLAVKAD